MFSSPRSTVGQRALGALRLTRSFLLLEDDYGVDWEVDDQDERPETNHPHRAPLRGRLATRRIGEPAPVQLLCKCPIGPAMAPRKPLRGASSGKSCGAGRVGAASRMPHAR